MKKVNEPDFPSWAGLRSDPLCIAISSFNAEMKKTYDGLDLRTILTEGLLADYSE